MRNIKLIFGMALVLGAACLTSCKDDDNSSPVKVVEDGFYVVGDATAVADLTAENAVDALMAAGINEAAQWNDDNTPKPMRDGMYEKYIALEGGKPFSIILKAGSVETKYGAELAASETLSGDGEPPISILKGTLTENGSLQVAESGMYHIVVDLNKDNKLDKQMIIIAPVAWGVRGVNDNWGTVFFDAPAFNKTSMTYTMTGVVNNAASNGFKFAYSGGWKIELNPGGDPIIKVNTNLGNVLVDGKKVDNKPYQGLLPGGGNIELKPGIYTITLVWNLKGGEVKESFVATMTKTGEVEGPEYPENLYVVGDGTSAGWTPANGIMMYPVTQTSGMYYGIVWFLATGDFKFCVKQDWGGDFGKTGNIADYSEFAKGTDNIPVPGTAGYYYVVVDMANERISVNEPKIYAAGDAFTGWGDASPANLFTVDNTAETITSPAALANGNLRAFIPHVWVSDWWKVEVCADGQGGIVFYNNPPSVPLTAGQKVVFNFNAGTSTIQ